MEVLTRAWWKVAPERQTESRKRVGFDGLFRRYTETGIDAQRMRICIGQSAEEIPNSGGNTVSDRPGQQESCPGLFYV